MKNWLLFYFSKWKGQGQKPLPGNDWRFSLLAAAGSFWVLFIVNFVDDHLQDQTFNDESMFALVGSFGAVVSTTPLLFLVLSPYTSSVPIPQTPKKDP